MLIAFAAGPLAAALGATVIGYFCVRLSSIYFAMLTLAFCQIAYAIVHQWYDVTVGDNGLLGWWQPRWLPYPVRYYYLSLLSFAGGRSLVAACSSAPFRRTLASSLE